MTQLEKEEYARLLRESQTKLWTIAAAIVGDRTLAEDIVQEAAITGLRRLADFTEGTNFVGWISQIVRFTALNHLKTRKRRKIVALDVHQEMAEDGLTKGDVADKAVTMQGSLAPNQTEFDDEVARAIQNLDPERRACFLLRVVHNLAYTEISEMLEIPPGTAMSHVHRAKTELRRALEATSQGDLR